MKDKRIIEKKANDAADAWSDNSTSYNEGVMMALQWVVDEDAPDPLED